MIIFVQWIVGIVGFRLTYKVCPFYLQYGFKLQFIKNVRTCTCTVYHAKISSEEI